MKLKKILTITISIIFVIGLGLLILFNFIKPYRYGSNIMGYEIENNNQVEKFYSDVNDFDGSSDTEIIFSINKENLNDLVLFAKEKEFNRPPLKKFNPGELEKYLSSEDSVFFKLEGDDISHYTLIILNVEKRKLIVKQVRL